MLSEQVEQTDSHRDGAHPKDEQRNLRGSPHGLILRAVGHVDARQVATPGHAGPSPRRPGGRGRWGGGRGRRRRRSVTMGRRFGLQPPPLISVPREAEGKQDQQQGAHLENRAGTVERKRSARPTRVL